MATYVQYRDSGGKTTEEGLYKTISYLIPQGVPYNNSTSALQAVQRGAGANMSVDISIGVAVMPNATNTYSYTGWTDTTTNLAITAADPTNPRIDTVVAYVDLSVLNPASNNNQGALKFFDVTGTPSGSPSAPSNGTIQAAVGAGNPWTPLANLAVAANATQIVTANITDTRVKWALRGNLWGGSSNTNGHTVPNAADGNVVIDTATQTLTNKTLTSPTINTPSMAGYTGWQTPSGTFTYAGNNGQKEFLVNTSVDLTGVIPVGAKFKITRGTAPPTQCMSFTAASSQYATKATPAGLANWTAFTAEAWVYLNSYGIAGSLFEPTVINRRNSTFAGGWGLSASSSLTNDGRVRIYYGSGANATDFVSYQSLPLKRWVHIAGVVTSTASKTGQIYINGAAVPTTSSSGAATALTQTTDDLRIGAYGGGTLSGTFFDGFMSEVRVWSVAQSQANIQANMAINLTGSETNLVCLIPGNGNFNDLTANANTLTATNGAIATQAANPYNSIEYGIITKITSTQLTVFTGTDYTIPNMTLNSAAYSLDTVPFGFPRGKYKWMVDYKYKTQNSQVVTSTSAWLNHTGFQFSIPTGDFDAQCLFPATITATSVAFLGGSYTLSTANNTQSSDELTGTLGDVQIANTEMDGPVKIEGPLSNTSQTTWFLNDKPTAVNGTTTMFVTGSTQAAEFRFFSAYV